MPWQRITDVVHLSFIGTEVEELIWDDAATRTASVLLQLDGGLGSANRIEIVAGIKHIATTKAVGGAVNLVRSRFEADTGDGAGLPAKFSFGIDLSVELLNGIDGYKCCSIAEDGRRVGHAKAHERFVIGDAIDDVTGVLGANAIGGLSPRTTAGVNRSARTQGDEILIVAAIQGKIVDNFVANGSAQRGGGGIQHGNFLGDSNGLGR